MSGDVAAYYFRVRENGAVAIRVDTENHMRRIEKQQIAVIDIRNGDITRHGQREPIGAV